MICNAYIELLSINNFLLLLRFFCSFSLVSFKSNHSVAMLRQSCYIFQEKHLTPDENAAHIKSKSLRLSYSIAWMIQIHHTSVYLPWSFRSFSVIKINENIHQWSHFFFAFSFLFRRPYCVLLQNHHYQLLIFLSFFLIFCRTAFVDFPAVSSK